MKRLPFEAKVPIFEQMQYRPTPVQSAIHRDESDTSLVAGGWRGGKSVVIAGEATPHVLIPSPRPYLVALIGPTYKEPRAEFDYMVEFLLTALPSRQFNEKMVSRPKDGPCEFTIPAQGSGEAVVHFGTVRTYTAAEVENIRSFNADAVIICEAGGISAEAFQNIVGRVLSTGGFILGSGTMEASQKWYHDLIKLGLSANDRGVSSFILPSWSNTVAFPGGRQDEKILRAERLLDPELFAVRIGAQPIRVTGVALKAMKPDHIVDIEFDDALPVELWIDPGYTGGYAVLAVQRYENQIRFIDEVYARFLSTREVIEECKTRPWWGNIDPEDPGVVDRAAKQKQAATGTSVLDAWYDEAGLWLAMTEQVIKVDDGLDQARMHLGMPGHVLISPKCRGLLAECDLGPFPEGFDNYSPWHYKQRGAGTYQGDLALAGADHSCTAMIYGLIYRYGMMSMDDLTNEFQPERLLAIRGTQQIEDDFGPEYGSTSEIGRRVG